MGDVSQEAIRRTLLSLAMARAPRTLCPSEAARALAGRDEEWRVLMDAVRAEAAALIACGKLEATQKGRVIADPRTAKGPIRLRLADPS